MDPERDESGKLESEVSRLMETDLPWEPQFLRAIIQELMLQHHWESIIQLLDRMVESKESLCDLAAPYVLALRGIQGHARAVEYLDEHRELISEPAVAIQWAAINCEIGDFEWLIRECKDGSARASPDDIDLNILLAWALENTDGKDNAEACFSTYDRVLKEQDLAINQKAQDLPQHPDAVTQPSFYSQQPGRLKSLWACRGRGDALARIGRKTDAEADWNRTAADANALLDSFREDFFLLRIAAWCNYRLGDLEGAAHAYRRALETGFPRYRPQFEHALVQFSMGRSSTAFHQYEKAICDSRELIGLRRAGLLRVALFQFWELLSRDGELLKKEHAPAIWEEMQNELEKTITRFQPGVQQKGQRIYREVQRLRDKLAFPASESERRKPSKIEVIDWPATRIVGFVDPGPHPCGVFPPVVEYRGSSLVCTGGTSEESSESPCTTLIEASGSWKHITSAQAACPTTRVVFLSAESRRILTQYSFSLPTLSSGDWLPVEDSDGGLAGILDCAEAEGILDNIAREIITVSVDMLAGISQKPASPTAQDTALLGYFAARRPESIYQAALCYTILSADARSVLQFPREAVATALPEIPKLLDLSKQFEATAKMIPRRQLAEWSDGDVVNCALSILTRANEISALKDRRQRSQEALWAAAEMQALLVDKESLRRLHQTLAQKIASQSMLYLNDDRDTIALSTEPEFYCSIQVPQLSKPAIDVISFFKAPGVPGATVFAEGSVAILAKAR